MAVEDAEYAAREANASLRDAYNAESVTGVIYNSSNALALLLGALLLEVAGLRQELKERDRS